MEGKENILWWEAILKISPAAYKTWFEEERRFLRENVRKGSSLLDVACGDGRTLLDLASLTDNLTGIDYNENAINHAKLNLKRFPKVKLLVADAKNLPFEEQSFDYVTCLATLGNFEADKLHILKEMKRVLKKDGTVLIGVYSEDALEERLSAYKNIGLGIKEITPEGTVIFEKSTQAGVSEQFSKKRLIEIFKEAGFKVIGMKKVSIAYLCKLSK